ncbi:pathogen-associated molecular patterns-induced protein A70-like [Phoenix dactylifera]|uniref:Pathogen-associated molecular patterns-induced protein A70-like n=1 Tax=Phoenix dactylifera TaxID=42345 RepID=A0A8B7BKY4_PHODC|nr:pathogen-associated molecular patterns-induced protein A70-like [Phoenix dactylifera]
MLGEAILSIWASFHGWLTPAVLFVLLNVVVGTIAVTSKGIRRDADAGDPRKLSRSPSLVLDRLRSFNLYRYCSGNIPLETAPPPPVTRSEPLETLHASLDPAIAAESEVPEAVPAGEEHHHFDRSQSDTHPTAGEVPVKLAAKMKKSASDKSAFAHFDAEEVEVMLQPATTRARTGRREAEEEDERGEVDARADDFINRFRQQLKLQRLNSIMRYREMLNRGAGN